MGKGKPSVEKIKKHYKTGGWKFLRRGHLGSLIFAKGKKRISAYIGISGLNARAWAVK